MKLVRYGEIDRERPGLIDSDGKVRSLYPAIRDWSVDMLAPETLRMLAALDLRKLPIVSDVSRLGQPIAGIRQLMAIGLNYGEHAREGGIAIPEYPLIFAKSIASLSGGQDAIRFPDWAQNVDWEVELAFFIGTAARDVSVKDALRHVAGYCCAMDVSERRLQLGPGGQVGHGKSLDSFTPLGPWFVTADEVGDPQQIDIWLDVNGEPRQRGSTNDMIFSVATIVAHLSKYQTLLPGDVVLTGTPAGVGHTRKPPQYLRPGDQVTCGLKGLGSQTHTVVLRE